jgi:hypothetical protein
MRKGKVIAARLKRMVRIEDVAANLRHRISQLETEWENLRDSDFLESEEYRQHCEDTGKARHYTFWDALC